MQKVPIPIDIKTIQPSLDKLKDMGSDPANKELAGKLADSLSGQYGPLKGQIGALNEELETFLNNPSGYICNLLQDYSGIITDGGDAYYQIALNVGKQGFKVLSESISELDFESLVDGANSLMDSVMDSAEGLIDSIFSGQGIDYMTGGMLNSILKAAAVDPKNKKYLCPFQEPTKGEKNNDGGGGGGDCEAESFNTLVSAVSSKDSVKSKDSPTSDIGKLLNSAEKEISDSRKELMDIIKLLMSAVNMKTQEYNTIAAEFTLKMSTLTSTLGDLLKDYISCEDIVDMVLDYYTGGTWSVLTNASLQNSLMNVGLSPCMVSKLTIEDGDLIESLLNKELGMSIKDSLGNIQFTKLEGFLDAQKVSQITKAITTNIKDTSSTVGSDPEKQKILNTAKQIKQSMNTAESLLKGI